MGLHLILLPMACECPACSSPPDSLRLKITDRETSKDLIYTGIYQADSISIYYFDDSESKKYIDFEIYTDTLQEKTMIESHEIGWKSAEGIKTYYLYLNSVETDTITLNVEERNDDCCTFFEFVNFEINGNKPVEDTDYFYNYLK